jgi:hypothetical protein
MPMRFVLHAQAFGGERIGQFLLDQVLNRHGDALQRMIFRRIVITDRRHRVNYASKNQKNRRGCNNACSRQAATRIMIGP